MLAAGRDTTIFSTEDASGSTSQAANIQEALEAGSQLLLLDEDTCATNFMIRDARMQVSLPHGGCQPAEHLWRHPQLWTQGSPMACLMHSKAGSFPCTSKATLQWFMLADSRPPGILLACTAPHDCGRAIFRLQLAQAHSCCCLLNAASVQSL